VARNRLAKSVDADKIFARWRAPGGWKLFAREVLKVNLDPEQESILDSCQANKMTSVVSGTGRGKDYTAAVVALCFLYLTPRWDKDGKLIANTKIALTAPTDRQVGNVMIPEITRIYQNAITKLPGRLVGYDIRMDDKEWFLTGFAADPHRPEVWAGFHAVNTMFIVTEASGVADLVFKAIEGNLQGDSRILIIFNFNHTTGYAADSTRSPRWNKIRLNSLNAPNVKQKKIIIPGQVDYEWVKDKVDNWCVMIDKSDYNVLEGDFEFEGNWYRPDDEFRKKILALPPKVSEGVLVPAEWIDLAFERWKHMQSGKITIASGQVMVEKEVPMNTKQLRLGVDVAGMGRDSSAFCHRYGNYVDKFEMMQSAGKANHMEVVGKVKNIIKAGMDDFRGLKPKAFIDTIGEGAGVYSRLLEMPEEKKADSFLTGAIFSTKYSEKAERDQQPLKDYTGIYEFLNLRAYLYWAIRDWLNPNNKNAAALPPDEELKQELSQTKWEFLSNGKIKIEPKEEIKKRLGRSPDKSDALANTFDPEPDYDPTPKKTKNIANFFH